MITIYPKLTDFSNGVAVYKLSSRATLVAYLLDESFQYGSKVLGVNRLILQYNALVDGEIRGAQTVTVIGLSDELISIKTDYSELLGQPLSSSVLERVYFEVEVAEDE